MVKVVLIRIRVNETNADGMQRKRGGSVTTGVESTEKSNAVNESYTARMRLFCSTYSIEFV